MTPSQTNRRCPACGFTGSFAQMRLHVADHLRAEASEGRPSPPDDHECGPDTCGFATFEDRMAIMEELGE